MDEDELFEALARETEEVREEVWELTPEQAERFLNEDGYVYVMTVFQKGEPQGLFTQKEMWEDPESFSPIMNDPNLTQTQKAAAIEERIRRSRGREWSPPSASAAVYDEHPSGRPRKGLLARLFGR
jgi:quinol monooxygenase YgiN